MSASTNTTPQPQGSPLWPSEASPGSPARLPHPISATHSFWIEIGLDPDPCSNHPLVCPRTSAHADPPLKGPSWLHLPCSYSKPDLPSSPGDGSLPSCAPGASPYIVVVCVLCSLPCPWGPVPDSPAPALKVFSEYCTWTPLALLLKPSCCPDSGTETCLTVPPPPPEHAEPADLDLTSPPPPRRCS